MSAQNLEPPREEGSSQWGSRFVTLIVILFLLLQVYLAAVSSYCAWMLLNATRR